MRVPARAFSSRSLLRGFTTDTLRCIPAPAASGGAESARSRAHSKNAANPSACLCTSPSAMFHFIIVIRFSERLKIRVKTKSEIQASLVFTVIFTLVYLAHCYPYLNTYGVAPRPPVLKDNRISRIWEGRVPPRPRAGWVLQEPHQSLQSPSRTRTIKRVE